MSYKVIIEKNSFIRELNIVKPQLIIADKNVTLPVCDYPIEYLAVSETSKNFDFYFQILNILDKYNLNRSDSVVIVGGGVLIDVASFAASTYKRGIKYINVPTTTLSMIDSSVGSKNGLNYHGVKNLIGNITDPSKVIIDVNFLQTLDERNYNNGIAEAIKIGYLSNNKILELLKNEIVDVEEVIKLSVEEKLKYVKQDKQDFGYRNYLNFGHTFGHAIESITNFERYYHGEAVSIGMVIASGYDANLIALLTKYKLPTVLPLDINIEHLIELMHGDKKNTSEKIRVVLKNPKQQIVEMTTEEVKKLFKLNLSVPNTTHSKAINVNKSKSHIHRLLAVALATKSKLSFNFDINNDLSDDVIQTINILKVSSGVVNITDSKLEVDCTNVKKPEVAYSVYKSATTYRMFTPILCSLFGSVEIKLDTQLASRPHALFEQYKSADVHTLTFGSNEYQLDGSISSQFVSGYIIALLNKNKSTTITIINQMTSIPYIDMTIDVVNSFGFDVKREENVITINPKRVAREVLPIAEPDYSSMAYFVMFNKLAEINKLDVRYQLPQYKGNSLQADSCIYNILDDDVVDMHNCPDLLPTLVVYGLLNKRGLTLTNVDRIKFKECDRVQAMIDNYNDLDAIKLKQGTLTVNPVSEIGGRSIKTYGDHRIAMAASIIAPLCNGPIEIDDYTVVNKSFPTYFSQLLGGSNECIK